MRIHCDACKAAIEQDQAVLRTDADGEIFYFCSEACADAADELDPDRELERAEAPPR